MATVQEHLESARQALAEDNPQEALRRLTYGFTADVAHPPLYTLAIECLERLGGKEEARLFGGALADFDSAQPFYDLGYHFVDVGYHRLALPFLERAHALAPERLDVAAELALTYNHQFQPQRARAVLASFDMSEDFWALYEFYWASFLCNELEGITDFIQNSRSGLGRAVVDAETLRGVGFALDKLEEGIQRLQAFPEPRPLVQDWHFIQYGGAILDYCDETVSEDGLAIAGGRWVALWASMEQVARVLRRLQRFLAEMGRLPKRVVGLLDRDSEIVARAAAEIMQLPYEAATPEAFLLPDTLIVAADARQLVDPALAMVQNGQSLFAFNICWLDDGGATPDVTGLLSQVCYYPWYGGAIRIDPETRQVSHSNPDERAAETIAHELAAIPPETDHRFDTILEFYRARAEYLRWGSRSRNQRLPFRTDSPVPGSYFA